MTCMDKLGRTCLLKVERNGYASKGKINATGRMYQFSSSLSTYNMYKTMVSRFSLKCFISPDVNFKWLVQYKYCTIQVPQYIITSNIHNHWNLHVRQFFLAFWPLCTKFIIYINLVYFKHLSYKNVILLKGAITWSALEAAGYYTFPHLSIQLVCKMLKNT